ncbi:MAG: alpha/beta fold hydrolase [Alphaproteobacteria bacterium]|nr:alpha/beta fold hydrolase [Alphaproteobacteria bacterium]
MFAKTRDGIRIGYSLAGQNESSRRLVLVHSLAMDREFWAPVAKRLEDEAAIITLDCRGHGASDKPAGPYTPAHFADDTADVMSAAGWDSAYVAGASMGGMIAIAFGQNHAARCRGLGLFDTTAFYGETAPKDWKERADKAAAEGLSGLVGFQKTRWFSDAFRSDNPQIVERSVEIFLRNSVPAYVQTCLMLGNADLRAGLPAMHMPVRIAVGEEDYATPPAMSQVLQAAIPGAPPVLVIKGGRHLTPLEVPDVIAGQLRDLMRA